MVQALQLHADVHKLRVVLAEVLHLFLLVLIRIVSRAVFAVLLVVILVLLAAEVSLPENARFHLAADVRPALRVVRVRPRVHEA